MVKSPLRYPGGKSRAVKTILPLIPNDIKEYREPFLGGASLLIASLQKFNGNDMRFWGNDINEELSVFWVVLQLFPDKFIHRVNEACIGKLVWEPKKFYHFWCNKREDFIDRAVRFFILNRITFSGTIESGGFSEESLNKRFTISSVERLKEASSLLRRNLSFTCLPYEEVFNGSGRSEELFTFMDPPYLSNKKSKLYGKNGDLHNSFDHTKFASYVKDLYDFGKWIITMDDCEEVRDLFSFANVYSWDLQYGMNNVNSNSIGKGKELFVTNYPIFL